MSNITLADITGVETMFGTREVPWYGLGTQVQEAVTSEEALHLAGLDWTVRQEEIVYDGEPTGYFMNIRSSDNKVLGVVGRRYKPVQNVDAFSFMDALIGRGVKYESAGSLNSGKRIWLLAKLEDTDIVGDIIEPYLCLVNSHDGFGSLKVVMTPVRVACQNALNLALETAKRMWSVRHTSSIEARLHEAQRTLSLSSQYMTAFKKESNELLQIKVAPKTFDMLSEKLFPITADMTPRKEESQLLLRDQLKHAWNMDDLGNIRGTGWGFLNAVSDMATHRKPMRKTDNYQENLFINVLDAPTLLDQAHALIKSL